MLTYETNMTPIKILLNVEQLSHESSGRSSRISVN